MTHEERANLMIDLLVKERNEELDRLVEARNEELERRRKVETELAILRRIFEKFEETADSGWLVDFLEKKARWSLETFGPGARTKGIVQHIRKELEEIEREPDDLMEWVDVFMLATDGFWRAFVAHTMIAESDFEMAAREFVRLICEKQRINEARKWPAPKSQDEAIEHIRSGS